MLQEKRECEMDAAEATKLSSPMVGDAMPMSKVLGDDNLLCEMLTRLDSPTCLVRAALVSKRWLGAASDRAFLRRFLALHPPHFLGFYVTGDCVLRPEFVPMPSPQPPDPKLSAVLSCASSVFDAFPEMSSRVWDCRNGRVLFDFTMTVHGTRSFGMRDPLRHPDRGMVQFPPPPPTWPACPHAMLLSDDDGDDDASCYRVDIHRLGRRASVQVSALRSGAWNVHCSAWANLAGESDRIPKITLLAGGKLYMVTTPGSILVLDLAAASMFFIDPPDGVGYEHYGNLVLSRGDGPDSAFYLVHLRTANHQLSVWLRSTAGQGAGEWVLKESISVRETCGHLVEQGSETAAAAFVSSVVGVGDNAEFVLMELHLNGVVVLMHLGSRKVEKVYQRDPYNDEILIASPFMTNRPPLFPALDADEGEAGHQE